MPQPPPPHNRHVNLLGLIGLIGLTACEKVPPPSDPTHPPSAHSKPFTFQSTSGTALVHLPGGTFTMGTNDGDPDEAPAHPVQIAAFVIDQHEVTHAQFTQAQLPNPSKWQDNPLKPVEQVRWRDAKQYCNERSLLEGLTPCYDETTPGWPCDFSANGYRLPTEAEWEYAARAGSTTPYEFGSESKLGQYAIFEVNSGGKTHPVKSKKPNSWGLYDLYGNVSEWCHDVYDPNYYQSSPPNNPTGPTSTDPNTKRALRGGSWKSSVSMCRVTFRQGQVTGDTDACFFTDYCGFRCVRKPNPNDRQSNSP